MSEERFVRLENLVSFLHKRIEGKTVTFEELEALYKGTGDTRLDVIEAKLEALTSQDVAGSSGDFEAMQARVDALAEMVARPQIISVSDQSQADLTPVLGEIDRIKGTHSELLRLVQKLAKDADALKNENVTLWKTIDFLISQATWAGSAKEAG